MANTIGLQEGRSTGSTISPQGSGPVFRQIIQLR